MPCQAWISQLTVNVERVSFVCVLLTGASVCRFEEGYPGRMQYRDIFIRKILRYVHFSLSIKDDSDLTGDIGSKGNVQLL